MITLSLRTCGKAPIVKEVRQARLEIEKECGGDFHEIYKRALKIQKKLAKKRVVKNGRRAGKLSRV